MTQKNYSKIFLYSEKYSMFNFNDGSQDTVDLTFLCISGDYEAYFINLCSTDFLLYRRVLMKCLACTFSYAIYLEEI